MRSKGNVSISSVAAMILVSTASLQADARPNKVDYNPAICQKSLNDGKVQYGESTITMTSASGTMTTVVCPLEVISNGDEPAMEMQISVQLTRTAAVAMCKVGLEDSWWTSIPITTVSGSTMTGTAHYPFPAGTSSTPTSFDVFCQFNNNGTLGPIQITTVPWPLS